MLVNGLDLRVDLDGSGPPLLLLHGFTGSSSTWDELRSSLRSTARLILVDLIGHGGSSSPADAARYSMACCIDDLAVLLDQLDIPTLDVLGYSMGGRVALQFASAQPRRVRRLLLESASPGLADASERAARASADEALAERIERDGLEDFVSMWEQQPLLALAEHVPLDVRTRQHQERRANSPVGLANSLRGMGTGRQSPLWDCLPSMPCPTLMLVGERDRRYCAIAERMLSLLPHAQLERIANAGHTAHIDQPARYAALVRSFLERA